MSFKSGEAKRTAQARLGSVQWHTLQCAASQFSSSATNSLVKETCHSSSMDGLDDYQTCLSISNTVYIKAVLAPSYTLQLVHLIHSFIPQIECMLHVALAKQSINRFKN